MTEQAEGRALAKPLTDAVHTQELVYFGFPFIAGPEGSYLIIIGPKFPIDDGIAGRVETLNCRTEVTPRRNPANARKASRW